MTIEDIEKILKEYNKNQSKDYKEVSESVDRFFNTLFENRHCKISSNFILLKKLHKGIFFDSVSNFIISVISTSNMGDIEKIKEDINILYKKFDRDVNQLDKVINKYL